ncbi:hypothetical protein [Microbacterium sp.]|uniref:SLAC1 family transporter n=1 Tax=Microbacterium sp. TaxID=51671 RepID=UPI003A9529B0
MSRTVETGGSSGTRAGEALPLPFFAIPFGLSGLSSVWTVAATDLGAPPAVGTALWILTAIVWVVLIVVYLVRARRARTSLWQGLHDSGTGPFAALIPVVAILLGGRLAHTWPIPGRVVVVVALGVLVILSAWSLSAILSGGVDARILHPAYYLFSLAAGLIGALGLAQAGLPRLATAVLVAGVVMWFLFGAAVIARLAAGTALPRPLLQTLAIFSVPPSIAGLAWFAIAGPHLGVVHDALLALTVFLLLGQAFLVPAYVRTGFGIGTWAFTFTAAAPAAYGVQWLTVADPTGGTVWAWVLVAVVTTWIAWVAVRTVLLLVGRLLAGRRRAAGVGARRR